MLIKFWLGLTLAFAITIFLMLVLGWFTKKKFSGPAPGVLIGFFAGVALIFTTFLLPTRAYVVTGDGEYVHYMVFGTPEYETLSGEKVKLEVQYDECYVINETENPVVIEEAIYGGYFGGSTNWVEAGEYEIMENHTIHYFYDNEPPDEISVNDDSEPETRLWLRKKRD